MSSLRAWSRLAGLGAALGGFGYATARIGAHVLDDAQLQQTAAIAALSFAAGAAVVAVRKTHADAKRELRLQAWALTIASLLLPLLACAWLRVAAVLPARGGATCAAALLLGLPLCAAGGATAWCATREANGLSIWLIGAGAGASLAMLGIESIGPERVLAQSCLLTALVALTLACSSVSTRADWLWLACGSAFLLALGSVLWAPRSFRVPSQPPPLGQVEDLRQRLAERGARLSPRTDAWDGFGHVETFELIDKTGRANGLYLCLRDSAFFASLMRGDGIPADTVADALDKRRAALCQNGLPGEPYWAPRPRVLVAGIGGGLELQCALQRGARSVDVAEPSRLLAQASADLLIPAGASSRVHYRLASARSGARGLHSAPYDLIVLAAAHTKHRLPPGVLPVPEALLETDRGLAELLSALVPDGILSAIVRGEPAALRLSITALSALRLLGEPQPQNQIVVHQSGDAYGVIVRRKPFSLEELLGLHRRNRLREPSVIDPLLEVLRWPQATPELRYTPGAGFDNRFGALFAQAERSGLPAFQRSYIFDTSAASDDRPLFYELSRNDRPDTWFSKSPYRMLAELALTTFAIALALVFGLGWRERHRMRGFGIRIAALFCVGAALSLAFAYVAHVIAIWVARPDRGVTLAEAGMLLGAAIGLRYGGQLLRNQSRPALFAHAIALVAFALAAAALGPMAAASVRANAVVVMLAALAMASTLGAALGLPACSLATDTQRPLALATLALAAACAVPSVPALVLFAGYGAVSTAVATLLAVASLLSLRART